MPLCLYIDRQTNAADEGPLHRRYSIGFRPTPAIGLRIFLVTVVLLSEER
jgi:hypothetical protein